jgi:hypothetical protein
MRLARLRPTDVAFLALSAIAVVVYLVLGRHATFHHDEWVFIVERSGMSLDVLLRPHNEHLSLGLVVVYRLLLAIVGMTSYIPYLIVVLLLHATAAGAVYVGVSTASGRWLGLAVATIAVFLGAGWENLFWGFQIGFMASIAAGAWALVILAAPSTTRRSAVASVLLTTSVAFSGMGLPFLAAAAAMIAYRQRARWPWLLPPVVGYAVWFASYGRAGLDAHRDPFTTESILQLPAFILASGSTILGGVSGASQVTGVVLLAIVGVGIAVRLFRGRSLHPLTVAGLVGVCAQLVLVGLVRAQFGIDYGGLPRYVSSAGVLLLLAIGPMLADGDERGPADLRVVLAGLVAVIAISGNMTAALVGREYFWTRAAETRALIAAIGLYGQTAGVDLDAPVVPYPTPRQMKAAIATYGSPERDTVVPDAPPAIPIELRDRMLYRLVEPGFSVHQRGSPVAPTVPDMLDLSGAVASFTGGCSLIDVNGDDPQVTLAVGPGERLLFATETGGEMRIFLARDADFQLENSVAAETEIGRWYEVQAPDLDDDRPWRLRLNLAAGAGRLALCMTDR